MLEHALVQESWASIFVIGCMIVGSIGVTVAVVAMLVFGIRRVANQHIAQDKAAINGCSNPDCNAGNPMTAVFCRRCGTRLLERSGPAARAVPA